MLSTNLLCILTNIPTNQSTEIWLSVICWLPHSMESISSRYINYISINQSINPIANDQHPLLSCLTLSLSLFSIFLPGLYYLYISNPIRYLTLESVVQQCKTTSIHPIQTFPSNGGKISGYTFGCPSPSSSSSSSSSPSPSSTSSLFQLIDLSHLIVVYNH